MSRVDRAESLGKRRWLEFAGQNIRGKRNVQRKNSRDLQKLTLEF